MIFFVTFAVFALVIVLMALGALMANKPLKGSCGGLGQIMGEDCAFCELKGRCKRRPQAEESAKA